MHPQDQSHSGSVPLCPQNPSEPNRTAPRHESVRNPLEPQPLCTTRGQILQTYSSQLRSSTQTFQNPSHQFRTEPCPATSWNPYLRAFPGHCWPQSFQLLGEIFQRAQRISARPARGTALSPGTRWAPPASKMKGPSSAAWTARGGARFSNWVGFLLREIRVLARSEGKARRTSPGCPLRSAKGSS